MTHFERDYLLNNHKSIFAKANSQDSLTQALAKQREELYLQLNYRELDRLSMELEKELKLVQTLRTELQKYKVEFELQVENDATKKIEEVVNSINKMFN